MNEILRQRWIYVGLVVADAASKLLAYLLLIPNQTAQDTGVLHLILRVNLVGLGSAAQSIFASSHGYHALGVAPLFCISLAALLLTLSYLRRLSPKTVLLGVAGTLMFALILARIYPEATAVPIFALRLSQCLLWVVVWVLSRAKYWKIAALLFAAASTGNFLSFLYPPYGIIDFLWSPLLNRIIGFGVFNVADILWMVGIVAFVLAFITSISVRLITRRADASADGR